MNVEEKTVPPYLQEIAQTLHPLLESLLLDSCFRPSQPLLQDLKPSSLSDDFPSNRASSDLAVPVGLREAMIYAVAGGKYVRPSLMILTAEAFGSALTGAIRGFDSVSASALWRVAAALEMVHAYSLAHDDLPAMDNSFFRRGSFSLHHAFGEAEALLAGNALLTYAFEMIAHPKTLLPAELKSRLICSLAQAAGASGMMGGQFLDISAQKKATRRSNQEKRPLSKRAYGREVLGDLGAQDRSVLGVREDLSRKSTQQFSPKGEFPKRSQEEKEPFGSLESILKVQAMKTGALMLWAVEAGALIGGASLEQQEPLRKYAQALGIIFQMQDDFLDHEEDKKQAQRDQVESSILNLITFWGDERSETFLRDIISQAEEALNHSSLAKVDTERLREMAHFFGCRSR